jgi:excisionase family DNA binding protein
MRFMPEREQLTPTGDEELSTRDVAARLGMAVRSVQLMVDRGELDAWKTPGGHRRISRRSVDSWLQRQRGGPVPVEALAATVPQAGRPRLLYIEDSRHFQNLVALLLRQRYPQIELHLADDGIGGLALAGRLQPELLLVDILLPGIDGATLITSLRSNPQFRSSRLLVVTSLDEAQREPYAFALAGVPVVHKPQLVTALPPLLAGALAGRAADTPSAEPA